MYFIILLLAAAALGCPSFVEFYPDPVDVSDQQGEFVEIRLDLADINWENRQDSLYILQDSKKGLKVPYPRTERLLLMHEGASCENSSWATCGTLGSISLPNSRETSWVLEWGDCRDSLTLPAAKPGKSLQRKKESDQWVIADATPGSPNPLYEGDVMDCGIESVNADYGADSLWHITFRWSGCDTLFFRYQIKELWGGSLKEDSLGVTGDYALQVPGTALQLQAEILQDSYAPNNLLDTLFFIPGKFPLVLSEIHHCPAEPEPEWVEVLNQSTVSLPMEKFRFCNRGGLWSGQVESGASVVFSKDTSTLREFLGIGEVSLQQVSLGFLNNTSGSLGICYGNQTVDSVFWDKTTVNCPLGFSPLTGRSENTPGFQNARTSLPLDKDVLYKLSSRVVRKNKGSLLVYVESEKNVELKLLDSSGRTLWRHQAPSGSNTWWKVPADSLAEVGIAYVSLVSGKWEKTFGILVRP